MSDNEENSFEGLQPFYGQDIESYEINQKINHDELN